MIAVDATSIVVLNEQLNKCETVDRKNIEKFKLWYAEPNHYGWTIPLTLIATFTHGLWLIFTAPINLIATICISVAGEQAYRYTEKDLSIDELRLFARFPQGVPPNVQLSKIIAKPIPKNKYDAY